MPLLFLCATHTIVLKRGSESQRASQLESIVPGKGVSREAESEGICGQTCEVTNRNMIEGLRCGQAGIKIANPVIGRKTSGSKSCALQGRSYTFTVGNLFLHFRGGGMCECRRNGMRIEVNRGHSSEGAFVTRMERMAESVKQGVFLEVMPIKGWDRKKTSSQ